VADEPFILFKDDTALREVIDKLCVEAGFEPKVAFEGLEERTVADLVGAGLGVALIPFIPDVNESKISVIRVRNLQCSRRIYMVWKAEGYMSPAVTSFKNFIIKNL